MIETDEKITCPKCGIIEDLRELRIDIYVAGTSNQWTRSAHLTCGTHWHPKERAQANEMEKQNNDSNDRNLEPAVTKFWHIAYVVPGTEKFFATELNRKAILCFFPVKLVLTPIGKKKAATLFPGYVFVHGASASKFFAENEAERFKGYLYTIMSAEESVPYYRLDNQTVLDLMDSMMKGEFDFTKPAAIGTLRVGDTVEHTIPQSEATFLKGTGVILSKNRKTAQLLWSNRVVKIPLLFLRKAVHKVSLTG